MNGDVHFLACNPTNIERAGINAIPKVMVLEGIEHKTVMTLVAHS